MSVRMGVTLANKEFNNMSLSSAVAYKEEITSLMFFSSEEGLPKVIDALVEIESFISSIRSEVKYGS